MVKKNGLKSGTSGSTLKKQRVDEAKLSRRKEIKKIKVEINDMGNKQ